MTGTVVGRYRLLERIGAGGMGEVYRAADSTLGRDVAIKVLPPAFARDEAQVARLRREARVLATLKHPGIAAVYCLEEGHGTIYLVLELVLAIRWPGACRPAPAGCEASAFR